MFIESLKQFLLGFEGNEWSFAPYVFATLLLRYILFAGGSYLLLWLILRNKLKSRRIQPREVSRQQMGQEIFWSISSIVMNSLLGVIILKLYFAGHTQIYLHAADYGGYPYILLSLLIYLAVHDAYFYWMHRALHTPFLFKHVHAIHHKPLNPTPFAAFCFHPIEAILEMAFLLPLILLVPIHFVVLIVFLILTFVLNVNGHLGYELLPYSSWRKWWGSWLTTSTHHNMHHQYFKSNYGLYLRFWDMRYKTMHPKTQEVFEAITSGRERPIR
jgi:Delta7-sterol 5-desaturase